MKTKLKGKILAILMSLAMAFTMMPMIGGVAYADDPVYTVTFVPGEGSGTQFTMSSKDAISYDDMLAGNYNEEKGCFFNTDWAMYYKLPTKCTFTAPSDNMEFGAWKINDDTYDLGEEMWGGWYFDDGSTSATITAIWKEVDPPWYEMVSVPEEINVNYCATRTTFDCQVKLADRYYFYDSTFTCSENGQSIPFTVNGNKINDNSDRFIGGGGTSGYGYFIDSYTTLPYTVPIYIDISDSAWSVAKPGSYTANIKMTCAGGEGEIYIPLTLTVPDKSIEHTVTVTNNGNGTASADPQSGTWGTEVTLTATPNPGCVFKEWQVISGGVTISNDKFTIGTEDVEIKAIFVKPVDVPEGKTLTYNGEEQSGVEAGEGYELINASATNADSYEATATLKDGYVWADEGTTDPKTIPWKINKAVAEDKVAIPEGKDDLIYSGEEQTGVDAGERYTLTDASATNAGDYTAKATLKTDPNYIYEWTDGSTGMQEISWKINKASVKVTDPAGKTFTYNGKAQTGVASGANYTLSGTVKATKAGTFTAKATLKTNANYLYKWADGTTAAKSIKWKINKAANPLKIKAKTATVKGSTKGKNGKLKKTKTLAVSKVIAFTKKGQGKMTYTKASGSKKITIAKTTGKVTVKKGLKKGTYKVKVKVKAAGNANYRPSAVKTVTFKVKVK